ncbi:MAG: class I SAM-dependent methyltransferase [Candidatus Parcubacteria bacterium]|nr:class I SAM-dependent methyltransferase [Burkholderiales bacterium]
MDGAEIPFPRCRGCGSDQARYLGPLPASNLFAGRILPEVLPGGNLYQCGNCALGYRYPQLSKAKLDELYALGAGDIWQASAPGARTDWTLGAREILERHEPGCRVADLGCFDGGFLALLGGHCAKSGIEINAAAAARAAAAGVHIIGQDFASLRAERGRFAAVTAFDVIEHVENPGQLLSLMAGALMPGGSLIISTGDFDSWTWRLMRNRYWYSAIPEHISYLSERWLRGALVSSPLRLAGVHRFSHAPGAAGRTAKEAMANLAYRISPIAARALRRGIAGGRRDGNLNGDYPPCWMSARDHFVAVMRKQD